MKHRSVKAFDPGEGPEADQTQYGHIKTEKVLGVIGDYTADDPRGQGFLKGRNVFQKFESQKEKSAPDQKISAQADEAGGGGQLQ